MNRYHSSPLEFKFKKSILRDYVKYNKNRDCKNLDLFDCVSPNIKLINDPKIIGAGSYGVLVLYKTRSNQNIGIKFIFNIGSPNSGNYFLDLEKELVLTYSMGEIGIGPTVHDSFYYSFEYGDFMNYPDLFDIFNKICDYYLDKRGIPFPRIKPLTNNPNYTSVPVEVQCIIMDAYDMDAYKALHSKKISISNKKIITQRMLDLLIQQIKEGIYCSDIKPQNYVVKFNGNNVEDVRMIDFGIDFCHESQAYEGYDNFAQMPSTGTCYLNVFYITLAIQLCIITDIDELAPIFLRGARKLMNKNWMNFLKLYIKMGIYEYNNKLNTPATNFIHYTKKVIPQGEPLTEDILITSISKKVNKYITYMINNNIPHQTLDFLEENDRVIVI